MQWPYWTPKAHGTRWHRMVGWLVIPTRAKRPPLSADVHEQTQELTQRLHVAQTNALAQVVVRQDLEGQLAQLKRKLERNRLTTPLFDIGLVTKQIERAFAMMYERHQAGLEARHLYVTP